MVYDPTATRVKSKHWVSIPQGVYPKLDTPEVTNPSVYIAGPMRGIPYFNADFFNEVALRLRSHGYYVFNPVDHDIESGFDPYNYSDGTCEPEDFDLKAALTWDLARVMEVDAVVTLFGVEKSKGAAVELALARAIGTRVISYYELVTNNFVLPPKEIELTGGYINVTGTGSITDPNKPYKGGFNYLGEPTDLKPMTGEELFEHLDSIPKEDVLKDGKIALSHYDKKLITDLSPTIQFNPSPLEPLKGTMGDSEQNISVSATEHRTVSATGGEKGAKLTSLSSIDPHALKIVGDVAGFGSIKYDKLNFMKGYDWSLSYDALQRHLLQFWSGQDYDEESTLLHLGHAAWHCLALISFIERGLGTDDRYTSQDMSNLQTKTIG